MAYMNWIVGQDCTTQEIMEELRNSSSFHLLFDKWTDVASCLITTTGGKVAIKQLKQIRLLNMDTLKSVVGEMLDIWVGEKGSRAYLSELINAFNSNGIGIFSEALEVKFNVVAKAYGTYKQEWLANLLKILCSEETMRRVRNQEKIYFDFNSKDKLTFPKDAYVLPKERRGCALLLNIFEYPGENRKGSVEDTNALRACLEQLGFAIFDDPELLSDFITEEHIQRILGKFLQFCEKEKAESVFVFIGSHGCHPNLIETSKEELVDIYQDIVAKFYNNADCSQHLKGKPKMFLIQACQDFESTDAVKTPGSTRDNISPPPQDLDISNTIICFSTFPGGASVRNPAGGTFFLWCFMEAMNVLIKQGFSYQQILDCVVKMTTNDSKEKQNSFQVPHFVKYDMKELYFDV